MAKANFGDVFNATISKVLDHQHFCAVLDSFELRKAMENINEKTLEQMFWIPQVGELFLTHADNNSSLLRATRKSNKKPQDKLQMFGIDSGKIFHCSFVELIQRKVFVMPSFLREIPPAAFKCILNENFSDEPLEKLLHQQMNLKVVEVRQDEMIMVDILETEEKKMEIVKCFPPITFHGNEHPIKFNQKTRKWKFPRIPQIYDEISNDTHMIYDIISPPLPERKKSYQIKIICFIDSDRFACHYYDTKNFYRGKSLSDLQKQMELRTFEHLKRLPVVGEIVIAEIAKKFYRAQVQDNMDNFANFPVFLVDEGDSNVFVPAENIFKYCKDLNEFPFFAVQMEFADLTIGKEHEKEAHNWILQMQHNEGPFTALIIENIDDIQCKLYDVNFSNVGKLLIENGVAEPKEVLEREANNSKQNIIIFPG